MAKPASPSKVGILTKWLGLQVAAKAVSLALGAPLVSAIVMGLLAYAQALPLAWAFLAIILAAAGTSTILNQARAFMVAYSVANKVFTSGVDVYAASNDAKEHGYAVGVIFNNAADIPLEYKVTRWAGHLEGRIVTSVSLASDGDVIEAGGSRRFVLGLVPLERALDAAMRGEVEIEYSYGKPGKLNNEFLEKMSLRIRTDQGGNVIACDHFT